MTEQLKTFLRTILISWGLVLLILGGYLAMMKKLPCRGKGWNGKKLTGKESLKALAWLALYMTTICCIGIAFDMLKGM